MLVGRIYKYIGISIFLFSWIFVNPENISAAQDSLQAAKRSLFEKLKSSKPADLPEIKKEIERILTIKADRIAQLLRLRDNSPDSISIPTLTSIVSEYYDQSIVFDYLVTKINKILKYRSMDAEEVYRSELKSLVRGAVLDKLGTTKTQSIFDRAFHNFALDLTHSREIRFEIRSIFYIGAIFLFFGLIPFGHQLPEIKQVLWGASALGVAFIPNILGLLKSRYKRFTLYRQKNTFRDIAALESVFWKRLEEWGIKSPFLNEKYSLSKNLSWLFGIATKILEFDVVDLADPSLIELYLKTLSEMVEAKSKNWTSFGYQTQKELDTLIDRFRAFAQDHQSLTNKSPAELKNIYNSIWSYARKIEQLTASELSLQHEVLQKYFKNVIDHSKTPSTYETFPPSAPDIVSIPSWIQIYPPEKLSDLNGPFVGKAYYQEEYKTAALLNELMPSMLGIKNPSLQGMIKEAQEKGTKITFGLEESPEASIKTPDSAPDLYWSKLVFRSEDKILKIPFLAPYVTSAVRKPNPSSEPDENERFDKWMQFKKAATESLTSSEVPFTESPNIWIRSPNMYLGGRENQKFIEFLFDRLLPYIKTSDNKSLKSMIPYAKQTGRTIIFRIDRIGIEEDSMNKLARGQRPFSRYAMEFELNQSTVVLRFNAPIIFAEDYSASSVEESAKLALNEFFESAQKALESDDGCRKGLENLVIDFQI